ncbi:succinate dehydrogenase assembly factor 2 [Bordetella sp. 15P40C-2]|uniref:succinate dehydrogenase assembly factor 2 n=1 Tax=Bordetella sp. 15P40C-2 TaxID=2572246 RepID=UPI00132986B5|nr:succinate dehydrogenase assembly factor 2 [Bordetella sp. 15P40C-2]MVW71833.1 succinate dehydrogenase assembly factor 2 [Bordetella sp. 15P40C-2]
MSGNLTELQRARLRWRARRGLLENDLIITRYLDAYETQLTDEDVVALTQLFELGDNDLLDLLLARKELEGALDTPRLRSIIAQMREL